MTTDQELMLEIQDDLAGEHAALALSYGLTAADHGERWIGVDLSGPLDVCVVVEGRRSADGQVRVLRAFDVRFGGAAARSPAGRPDRLRRHAARLRARGVDLKVL